MFRVCSFIARHFGKVLLVWLLASGLAPLLAAQTYSPPANARSDINLDANWRFIRQDVPGAQTNGFDDSAWTTLNLPHTGNHLDGPDGGNYWIESDNGTLTLSGAVPASTPGGSRTLSFLGNANIVMTGVLQNGAGGGTVGVIKSGNGTLTLASINNNLTGGMAINGGTLQVGNGISDGTLGVGNITNNGIVFLDVVGAITIFGSGSLTENNSGSVTLSAVNSYTGLTRVTTGTLLVNGTLGAIRVTVSGGTLGGNGVINGTVTVQPGGRLAPGNSIGVLTISNSLALGGNDFH